MTDPWISILSHARKCIVQIRCLTVRTIDGNEASPSVGTAFIVDKHLGILLTNRHIVSTAPIRAHAVFLNDEQVQINPLYIDPIHDFAFFKFNPNQVKYMKFDELILKSTNAKSGLEIRVIGSDAGEKTMVLGGTISRIDRNPPEYESGSGFIDHHTFYIAAACDTSGGSSGSPVLDKTGAVIALNAGASAEASSSFFLPLNQVVRALAVLRKCCANGRNNNISRNIRIQLPRGTLQCVLNYTPMPECKRLGITKEEELALRSTLSVGTDLLVMTSIIPLGPADRAGTSSR